MNLINQQCEESEKDIEKLMRKVKKRNPHTFTPEKKALILKIFKIKYRKLKINEILLKIKSI